MSLPGVVTVESIPFLIDQIKKEFAENKTHYEGILNKFLSAPSIHDKETLQEILKEHLTNLNNLIKTLDEDKVLDEALDEVLDEPKVLDDNALKQKALIERAKEQTIDNALDLKVFLLNAIAFERFVRKFQVYEDRLNRLNAKDYSSPEIQGIFSSNASMTYDELRRLVNQKFIISLLFETQSEEKAALTSELYALPPTLRKSHPLNLQIKTLTKNLEQNEKTKDAIFDQIASKGQQYIDLAALIEDSLLVESTKPRLDILAPSLDRLIQLLPPRIKKNDTPETWNDFGSFTQLRRAAPSNFNEDENMDAWSDDEESVPAQEVKPTLKSNDSDKENETKGNDDLDLESDLDALDLNDSPTIVPAFSLTKKQNANTNAIPQNKEPRASSSIGNSMQ